jgi:hypothetical protein
LHALRLERGAVFTPDRPFTPGEHVTVRTQVTGEFSFTVAHWGGSTLQPVDLGPASRLRPGRPTADGIGWCTLERRRYRTLPELRPVDMCATRPASGSGRVFVTPRSHPERRRRDQHSVMMLSDRGEVLWYSPRPYVARDLKTVRYRGRRMLALYQWVPQRRAYYGLLDRRYRTVKRIRPGNGYTINTHELQITPRGSAYLYAYQPVRLPGYATPVMDVVIQEIDLRTGDVLFEWHALDHVPPSASYQLQPADDGTWDYFHGNSIEPPLPGRRTIVISARNTSAVYGIDRRTGAVLWTLGGRQDQFGLGRFLQFCAQHDARRQPNGDITIFDNGGPALGNMVDCPIHKARVLRFRLDLADRRARLAATIPSEPSSEDGNGYWTWAMGNAQRQGNGDMLINWGTTGRLTRVTSEGRVVQGLRLERYTYRGFRGAWTGRPGGRPLVVARRGHGAARLWASWNGATEIARWRVLAGRTRDTLVPMRSFPFRGLETSMRVATRARFFAVVALDARGVSLGRSAVVRSS